jgi:hypothetical protein
MPLRVLRFYATLLVLCVGSLFGAEEGWTQLKLGMTTDQAVEALGDPLIKTIGGGFELWIYDNHAEVVFYGGPMVGWTTPSKGKAIGRPVDVWQHPTAAIDSPVFILPRRRPLPVKRIDIRSQDAGSVDTLPFYRVRN